MDDGSGERDDRRKALVGLRPDPEHRGCDIFTRRVRDIYSRRLQAGVAKPQVLRLFVTPTSF
jgi:hypothetical protein